MLSIRWRLHKSSFAWRLGIAVFLIVLTFVVYQDILGYFFTGRDAISFVAEGRVHNWRDVIAFFTRRQFSGSTFPGAFYRPVSSLSFAFDVALWGLNPFGYHLTDLLVHGLVSLLVYLLGRRMMHLSQAGAFLAAVLFVIHPTHQGIIPVVARRIDPIATLWAFLALLLFVEGHRNPARAGLRVASWTAYGLALLSKETAVVAMPVMGLWVLAHETNHHQVRPWRAACRELAPIVLITLGFLVLRTLILGGLGGYADKSPLTFDAAKLSALAYHYWLLLFNPFSLRLDHRLAAECVGLTMLALIALAAYGRWRWMGCTPFPYLLGVVWVICLLLLLLAAQTLTTQHAYTSLAWLCLLGARLGEDSWALLCLEKPLGRPPITILRGTGLLGLMGVLILAGAILWSSPLREHPRAWQEVGESQKRFLLALEGKLLPLPDDRRVGLSNLPFLQPVDPWQHQVAYLSWLSDYAILDWLAMRYPDRHWNLTFAFNTVQCLSLDFSLEEASLKTGEVLLYIQYPNQNLAPVCSPRPE